MDDTPSVPNPKFSRVDAASSRHTESGQHITIADLAGQFSRKRRGRSLTLEQAGDQIGVSAATLSRFERLRSERQPEDDSHPSFAPDTRTISAVARWLGLPSGLVIENSVSDGAATLAEEAESVPDVVEAHLRADRNLDDASALALAKMFRMAYDQFSRIRPAGTSTNNSIKSQGDDE